MIEVLAFMQIVRGLLYVIFGLSALLLIIIILLQEGKGGGLAAAFGGAGTDAFGVSAGGINKFTSTLAGVFVVTAIILAATAPDSFAPASDVKEETPADTKDEAGSAKQPAEQPPEKAPPEKSAPAKDTDKPEKPK